MIECANSGCNHSDLRKNILNHSDICQNKEMKCKWCKLIFKRHNIGEHEDQCDLKIIPCDNLPHGCLE